MLIFQYFVIVFIVIMKTEAAENSSKGTKFKTNVNFENQVKWTTINDLIKKSFDTLFKSHLKNLWSILEGLNTDCQDHLSETFRALRNTKGWALHMVDATGKIPSGILEGTVMDVGSYDECLKIRVNDSSNHVEEFRGQYCMVGLNSPLLSPFYPNSSSGKNYTDMFGNPPEWIADSIVRAAGYLKRVSIWIGVCIPSSCDKDDLMKLASSMIKPLGVKVSIADCQIDGPSSWPSYTFIAICILTLIAGICILGTIIDIVSRFTRQNYLNEYLFFKLLKFFSIYTNTEKLFCNIPDTETLGCFHGIRFFSATWIVLGHTYFFTDHWKYIKYRSLLEFQRIFNHNLPLAALENFTIPVGSFFFMSGFLLVYSTWRKLEKNSGKLNLFMFFIHKYWRMTPALGLMIIMLMAMPIINAGPIWNSTLDPPIQACQRHWWTNMLYINNWYNSEDFCIIHTWYLAALMQFHIIGVIVLLVIYRWKIFGSFLGFTIAIGSCIYTSFVAAWNNYPMPAPGYIRDMDIVDDYNTKIYIRTFNHTATYFIGMLTAFIFLKFKDKKLSAKYQVFGWILAIAGSLSALYGLYGPANSIVVRSFYIGFHRIGWTFGVSWVAYSCITGNGGIINRFLSWKAFVPLGQLSYLVYLIHPLVILYRTASLRERIYFGHTDLVFEYLAYTLISFFLAFIGYVTVETPFMNLEGLIFSSKSPDLSKTSKEKEILPTSPQTSKDNKAFVAEL